MDWDKKQERKKALEALTRQGVLDAATKLLMSDGIQGLTMDRVAMEAGVAKGTLYVHFKNKEDILDAALDASFEPLFDKLTNIIDTDKAPDKKLEDFSLCHLRFFDEKQDLIRVFFNDRERTHSKKNHFTDSKYLTILSRVADTLKDGMDGGIFLHLDPMKVAAMFTEANIGLVMQRIIKGTCGDIEKDAKQITDVFMYGLKKSKDSSSD